MDKQIINILKQHIQWKNYCIDSLNTDEFTNYSLSTTAKTIKKMFERDKFFLELYLRTISPQAEICTHKIN